MTTQEFANELRAHRETKEISLMDIASATKIHPKYLQAIEEGDYSFLPRTYVRAFIRDYAKVLGLDPDVTLQRYYAALEATQRIVESEPPVRETPQEPSPAEKDIPSLPRGILLSLWISFQSLLREQTARWKFFPVAAILLLAVAIVLVANMTRNSRKDSIVETPFEEILKEKETQASRQQGGGIAANESSTGSIAYRDSLVLEGRTTEDVWMIIHIDDRDSAEYLFPPKAVRRWKAREKFLVTLGNAGGMSLRINGKDLGTLGKSGAVARDLLITRDGVQK